MAVYDFNCTNKGKCLILNYENFETESKRNGTDKDAAFLKEVFSKLHFDVKSYKDLTCEKTFAVLDKVARDDFSNYACFVCCILTHGDDGLLNATDKKYPFTSVLTKFSSKTCPNLEGKPKIFFIQACQGTEYDDGVTLETADCISSYDFPKYVDFLVVQSTPPGYFSWRGPEKGSWFIQKLCQCLVDFSGEDLNILKILRLVNYRVAYESQSYAPSKPKIHNKKQVPCMTSTLRKKIVLSKTSKQMYQSGIKSSVEDDVDKGIEQSHSQQENHSMKTLMMPLDSDVYFTKNPENIKCFIIYHEVKDFDGQKVKHLRGSASNALKLYHHLTKFGFSVNLMKDFEKKEIYSKLLTETENPNSDIECVLCFIITRTDEDNFIYAKDGKYTRECVTSMFNGNKCPGMASIPKVFVFLVCKSEQVLHESADSGGSCTIPIEADFLIVDSVLNEEDFVPTTTRFIENLNSSLKRSRNQMDIFELLVLLNGELTNDRDNNRKNEKSFVLTSTLTRELVLKIKT